jgi:fatty acid desaturase
MAKHLFLSQGIGYHLAHHVDSGIPMANLAKLHRALEEDGYISESFSYPGYWNFIGKLWRKDG